MTSYAQERTAQAAEALAASSFSITIDGVEIAQFSELVELSSGLDPSTLTLTLDQKKGQAGLKKLPGKRTPPTVTLKRAMSKDLSIFEWHSDALHAGSTARRSAVLATHDSQGRTISS
jgi:phage tail-like protein